MICKTCDCDKPIEQFQIDRHMPNGYKLHCKTCTRVTRHETYVLHREARINYSKRWRAANPERYSDQLYRNKLKKVLHHENQTH